MAKSMPITGRVLEWTLHDRDLSISEVAGRLDVDVPLVRGWINEETTPNKGQFNKLVKLLGCSPSFLFLPEPPARRSAREVSFRKHPNAPDQIPGETATAVRTAQLVLKVAHWLDTRAAEQAERVPIPRTRRDEDPELVAERLRKWLDWSPAHQTGPDTTDTSAAKAMRGSLQLRGVFVLHFTMDDGITRGFSLHDGDVSLIAINTRDHVRARLFSYAHELAHLALRDDSVCLTRSDQGTEGFCNRVAAALLMPEQAFRSFVDRRMGGRVNSRDNVVSVRNFFKVSLQAAAIRAETLGVASPSLYEMFRTEPEAKGQRGGTYVPGNERTRPKIRVDQYGFGFVTSLLDAEETGRLKRSQVLDLLSVSDQELESVRTLAASGTTG